MIRVISIQDLLGQLADGSWKLPLAQRDLVWNEERMSLLVDSLLRDFPIGSLLVATGMQGDHYSRGEGAQRPRGARRVKRSQQLHTQILDGQQRCDALERSFGGRGLEDPRTGAIRQLWINLSTHYPSHEEFHAQRDRRYSLHWSCHDLNAMTSRERQREQLKIGGRTPDPTSGWIRVAELRQMVEAGSTLEEILRRAQHPEPTDPQPTAEQIVSAFRSALTEARVPVHSLPRERQGESESELFHMFVRINTAGVRLSAPEEFLAGVKRYWPRAEERLEPFMNILSPLDRKETITLIARIALVTPQWEVEGRDRRVLDKSGALEPHRWQGDSLPIRLRDLAGARESDEGNRLVRTLEFITNGGLKSPLGRAMDWVSRAAFHRMHLGIHGIRAPQWMAAVAWASAWIRRHGSLPAINSRSHAQPLCWFLFWSSAVSSQAYGRSHFGRKTFDHAFRAGLREDPEAAKFPIESLLSVCFSYSRVIPKLPVDPRPFRRRSDDESWRSIRHLLGADQNRWLFLGLFQAIGGAHPEIDAWESEDQLNPRIEWDHIFAQARAKRLFKTGRKAARKYTRWVNQMGNLAGISTRVNRHLSDDSLQDKLAWKASGPAAWQETYRDLQSLRADPRLNEAETAHLQRVHAAEARARGTERAAQMEEAGEAFIAFVHARNRRIWEAVLAIIGAPPDRERILQLIDA